MAITVQPIITVAVVVVVVVPREYKKTIVSSFETMPMNFLSYINEVRRGHGVVPPPLPLLHRLLPLLPSQLLLLVVLVLASIIDMLFYKKNKHKQHKLIFLSI
eukprot:scaffold3829_cov188-Ochromonas_danica.AAC.2